MIYIKGRKESKKRIERVERMKERKRIREKEFLLVRDDSYIKGGKPFYRFS